MPSERAPRREFFLWLLLLLYVCGRFLQLGAGRVPALLIVLLHVGPPALFAFVHGRSIYRTRGILVFIALSLGVGGFFESLSLRTGFPFGRYYFTDVMGPKLFELPVLLVLAYVGMGYVSWVLAIVLLGHARRPFTINRVVALPLIASFIMVGWDLAMDPVWANIDRAWVWKDGGAYFGVPVSNYLGWYLTVFVTYQLFALYLRSRTVTSELTVERGRLAILFYGVCASGNLLLIIPKRSLLVTDGTGKHWFSADIIGTCVIVSVFVMGSFAILAWLRAGEPEI